VFPLRDSSTEKTSEQLVQDIWKSKVFPLHLHFAVLDVAQILGLIILTIITWVAIAVAKNVAGSGVEGQRLPRDKSGAATHASDYKWPAFL
jgi:hypothetical protein